MSDRYAGGIKSGRTSVSVPIEMRKSVDGTEFTALAYNTSGLTAAYWRQGGSPTAITLVTLANAAATWASGGFVEVSSSTNAGVYRLDVPDAAFAAGADWVEITVMMTGAFATNFVYALESKGCSDLNDVAATAIVSAGAITTSGGKVSEVALVDVLTTYTGNTVQTGDAFARLGSNGAGLTALGDSRIANLDATVSSRSTFAGGAVASVTGAVGSVTSAVTVGTNNDKTGYALTSDYDAAKVAASQSSLDAFASTTATNFSSLDSSLGTAIGDVSTELTSLTNSFNSFDTDFDTFSTNVLGLLDGLTTALVPMITSPLTLNGSDLTLYRGTDYVAAQSTAIVFNLSSGPDLTTATVTLLLKASSGVASFAGTVLAAREVQFELTAAQTTAMQNTPAANGRHEVHATLATKILPVQATGRLAVLQPLHL